MRFAIIGYGEVGGIMARDLHSAGASAITAFDIAPQAMARARADKVVAAGSAAMASEDADVVLLCVTAGSTLDAAGSLVGGLAHAPFVVDLNSVSPATKQQVARTVGAAGGRYVEAAVMSSIGPKGLSTPMLLGGPHAMGWLEAMRPHALNASQFSPEIGPASAVKMCRSIMIKGLEALTTESMLTARAYGVEDAVLASLAETIPSDDWHSLAKYLITRSLLHGQRRAEEVREVSFTVSAAGQLPILSDAISRRQEWSGSVGQSMDVLAVRTGDIGELLDAILATTQSDHRKSDR